MKPPECTDLIVPIAGLDDAKRTCEELAQYLDDEIETITVVHVIEQTDGYMDTTSPEALEREARELFTYVADCFGDGPEIRRELRYGTDVVEEIVDAADDRDVSAIGFAPRPKSKLQQLLTENASYRLITESHQPVVVFSRGEND